MASFLVVNLHVSRGKKHNQTLYSQRFFLAEFDFVYRKICAYQHWPLRESKNKCCQYWQKIKFIIQFHCWSQFTRSFEIVHLNGWKNKKLIGLANTIKKTIELQRILFLNGLCHPSRNLTIGLCRFSYETWSLTVENKTA